MLADRGEEGGGRGRAFVGRVMEWPSGESGALVQPSQKHPRSQGEIKTGVAFH